MAAFDQHTNAVEPTPGHATTLPPLQEMLRRTQDATRQRHHEPNKVADRNQVSSQKRSPGDAQAQYATFFSHVIRPWRRVLDDTRQLRETGCGAGAVSGVTAQNIKR